MVMTNMQLAVLGNVKRGLPYGAGISHYDADGAYLWLVNNGYIRDGVITPAGEAELAPTPAPPPAEPVTMEVVTLHFTDGTSATYSGAVQMGTTGKALKGATMRHMTLPEGCTLETLRSIGGTPNGASAGLLQEEGKS